MINMFNEHIRLTMKVTIVTSQQIIVHPVSILVIFVDLILYIFLRFIDANAYNIPMSRRLLELVKKNVGPVVYDYPIRKYE